VNRYAVCLSSKRLESAPFNGVPRLGSQPVREQGQRKMEQSKVFARLFVCSNGYTSPQLPGDNEDSESRRLLKPRWESQPSLNSGNLSAHAPGNPMPLITIRSPRAFALYEPCWLVSVTSASLPLIKLIAPAPGRYCCAATCREACQSAGQWSLGTPAQPPPSDGERLIRRCRFFSRIFLFFRPRPTPSP